MLALGCGLLAALLWGFHDLAVRHMSARSDMAAGLLVVLLAGAVCLLPLLALPGVDLAPPAGRALALTAAAGLSFAVAAYCLWGAFRYGPVRIVSPITAAYPVVSLGLAIAAGASVPALAWVAVLGVIAGVAIVASGEPDSAQPFSLPRVIAWSVAAAIGYATTFALGQAVMVDQAAVPTFLITRLAAAVAIVALMLVNRRASWPRGRGLWLLVLTGALDAFALSLVFYAGRLPDASYATVTASLFGVITILLAAALLRERLTARQWAGVVVCFVGVGVLARVAG